MFLIMFCIPFISQVILISIGTSKESNILISLGTFVTVIFMLAYFLWIWTLGVELNKLVDTKIRKKTTIFKIGLIFTVIESFLFSYDILRSINSVSYQSTLPSSTFIDLIFIFVSLYCIYFVAKNLVMAEKQEKDETNDFIGPFFMIWVFPIGIWKLQPRIIRLFQHSKA